MSEPLRRSPASGSHAALGAVFETDAAWQLPASYGDESAERELLRASVAIVDVTARGKIDVRGSVGPSLGAATDALVAKIAPDWALVLTEPGGEEVLEPKLTSAAGPSEMVTDVTHLHAGFVLAGPKLPELLARTTAWDPTTLAPGEATGAPIVEIRAVMVRRDASTLEIYVASEFGRYAWETLLGVAQGLDGGPAGWRALRARGWS
jgi:heterotetrameric sarcosine oxidase gamma subunit